MSEFADAAEDLVGAARDAQQLEGIDRLRAENQVVGDACETVAGLSQRGDISESEMHALADTLADELAKYTKTDIKNEVSEHFAESGGEGVPFDELLSDRLEELAVVHSTDAKQGTVWRWHFSDGVQLETQVSKDGGRKHYDWQAFKRDYFDCLVTLGAGQQIADPSPDLRDPEDWQAWIDELILDHDPRAVEHVGPRTEAVEMLRDYVERNVGYRELSDVRDRQGIWMPDGGEDVATDGGGEALRIPAGEVKRICDQVGISTRALQIELQARGLTLPDVNGVSDAAYDDGVRVPYWVVAPELGDPEEVVETTETPAEQVAREEREREEEERTDLGAVGDDSDDSDDEQDVTEPAEPLDDLTDPLADPDSDDADDHESGLTDGFGVDPDDDGGDGDE